MLLKPQPLSPHLLNPRLPSVSKIPSGKLVFANDGREAKRRRVVEAKQSKQTKRRKSEELIEVGTGELKITLNILYRCHSQALYMYY